MVSTYVILLNLLIALHSFVAAKSAAITSPNLNNSFALHLLPHVSTCLPTPLPVIAEVSIGFSLEEGNEGPPLTAESFIAHHTEAFRIASSELPPVKKILLRQVYFLDKHYEGAI